MVYVFLVDHALELFAQIWVALFSFQIQLFRLFYIGKTERCLISRMNEHGTRDTEPMFKHLSECVMFKETCNLYALPSLYNGSDPNEISLTSHVLRAVLQNHEILDFNHNWSQLLFLEAYYIKKHDPVINHSLKASKELLLFN